MSKETKQKPTIKTLSHDEKGLITIKHVGDRKVQCDLTAKPTHDSPVRFQMRWAFDFSNMTPQEVEEIAANYLKIRTQDAWRKDGDYADPAKYDKVVFDVKEVMSKARANRSNPVNRVKKLLEGATPEEKEAILAQIAG